MTTTTESLKNIADYVKGYPSYSPDKSLVHYSTSVDVPDIGQAQLILPEDGSGLGIIVKSFQGGRTGFTIKGDIETGEVRNFIILKSGWGFGDEEGPFLESIQPADVYLLKEVGMKNILDLYQARFDNLVSAVNSALNGR